jgi:hypothetical protein
VGITESWATSEITEEELQINGFKMYRKDMKGGGLLLYISNNVNNSRQTLCEEQDFNESIWCRLDLDVGKVLIGMCYRSPASTNLNNDKLLKLLKEPSKQSGIKHVHFLGDFDFPKIDFESRLVKAGEKTEKI